MLKFPSGRASVSIRELQKQQQTQKGCGICDEPWVGFMHECLGNRVHVFHPCQHVVGSRCWSSVKDEQKGKCPVCKIEVRCDEKIDVHAIVDRCAPASANSQGQEPESFLILTQDLPLRAQALEVEDGRENGHEEEKTMAGEKKEGLDDVDVDYFWSYMDLRARVDYIRDGLDLLRASTETLTPIRWDRMTRFRASTAQNKKGSKRQRIDIAMFSSGGAYYTMDDLRETLSSAEEWINENSEAINDGRGIANKDVVSLRKLEKKLADVQAEIKELKDLESREIARRREAEFEEWKKYESRESARRREAKTKQAIREITKKADEEVATIRAEADDKVEKVRAKASAEIAKAQSHGKVVEM